ncbi:MAG: hypothetical protein CME36_19795 [unclassified Hahellaceae]|nr:hypothetical protein [Hahellaceae bacterium]
MTALVSSPIVQKVNPIESRDIIVPPDQPTVDIVKVHGRSEHGMTKPFRCVGDDGVSYYVKGISAGRRSQINEWIAGRLALDVARWFRLAAEPNQN